MVPDSIVVHRLGDSLTTILFEPESVVAYVLLQPSDARSAKKKFVRTSSRQLSPEQKDVLYAALINNLACYGRDSITVMSPYMPAMEIVFANDTCEASVVVSFSDRSWGVVRDGKSMFNYNYTDARPLKEIYNSIDSAYHY